MPEKMTNSENKRSKGFRMPGAFTILFILTIFSVLATWWIPAGSYSKLQFDTASSKLVVTDPMVRQFMFQQRKHSWIR